MVGYLHDVTFQIKILAGIACVDIVIVFEHNLRGGGAVAQEHNRLSGNIGTEDDAGFVHIIAEHFCHSHIIDLGVILQIAHILPGDIVCAPVDILCGEQNINMYLVKIEGGIALACMAGVDADHGRGFAAGGFQLGGVGDHLVHILVIGSNVEVIKILLHLLRCGETVIDGVHGDLFIMAGGNAQKCTEVIQMQVGKEPGIHMGFSLSGDPLQVGEQIVTVQIARGATAVNHDDLALSGLDNIGHHLLIVIVQGSLGRKLMNFCFCIGLFVAQAVDAQAFLGNIHAENAVHILGGVIGHITGRCSGDVKGPQGIISPPFLGHIDDIRSGIGLRISLLFVGEPRFGLYRPALFKNDYRSNRQVGAVHTLGRIIQVCRGGGIDGINLVVHTAPVGVALQLGVKTLIACCNIFIGNIDAEGLVNVRRVQLTQACAVCSADAKGTVGVASPPGRGDLDVLHRGCVRTGGLLHITHPAFRAVLPACFHHDDRANGKLCFGKPGRCEIVCAVRCAGNDLLVVCGIGGVPITALCQIGTKLTVLTVKVPQAVRVLSACCFCAGNKVGQQGAKHSKHQQKSNHSFHKFLLPFFCKITYILIITI